MGAGGWTDGERLFSNLDPLSISNSLIGVRAVVGGAAEFFLWRSFLFRNQRRGRSMVYSFIGSLQV